MALVTVDIELDEVDSDDLIIEVVSRIENGRKRYGKKIEGNDLRKLRGALNMIPSEFEHKIKTVPDQMKVEFLAANWDRITLEQLESLIQ